MTEIVKKDREELVARAADFSAMGEDELRRYAAEAARDRDVTKLWALTEAHLTLHGVAGALISPHTLVTYRYGVMALLEAWQGENLLRPARTAGVLWVRGLEVRFSPGTVRSRLSGARALYAALRWSGATETTPFLDVKPARDPTPAWAKRDAYERHEVKRHEVKRLEVYAEGANRLIVLLGAHAGLRVSEMTALRWEDIDLANARLKVRSGKGGKAALVELSGSLVTALGETTQGAREGYVLPCRAQQSVYERLATLCRTARIPVRGVHALRHAAGTRLRAETGDLAIVADHLRHATLETARGYAKSNNAPLKRTLGSW